MKPDVCLRSAHSSRHSYLACRRRPPSLSLAAWLVLLACGSPSGSPSPPGEPTPPGAGSLVDEGAPPAAGGTATSNLGPSSPAPSATPATGTEAPPAPALVPATSGAVSPAIRTDAGAPPTAIACGAPGADACGACVCERCADELAACSTVEGCVEILACVRTSGCSGRDCYCGSASLTECLAGQAQGPCVEVVLRAPGANPPTLQDRSAGPASDAALQVADCAQERNACRDVCGTGD